MRPEMASAGRGNPKSPPERGVHYVYVVVTAQKAEQTHNIFRGNYNRHKARQRRVAKPAL